MYLYAYCYGIQLFTEETYYTMDNLSLFIQTNKSLCRTRRKYGLEYLRSFESLTYV